MKRLFVLMAALLGAAAALAQTGAGGWVAVPGSALAVAVGGRGAVGAMDAAGTVSRRDLRTNAWQEIGRSMARIAVDAAGGFWAIDRQGTLLRLEGREWRAAGQGAAALAAAPDGSIIVATDTGSLARFEPATSTWTAIPGRASRVAVDARGLVWAVAADGSIARRLGDSWVGVTGRAKEIAADVSGNVVIVGQDGKVYEWIEADARWSEVSGTTSAASVGVGGAQLWRADADGRVYARGLRSRNQSPVADADARARTLRGTTDKLAVPDASPLEFTRVAQAAGLAELAIGQDGSVYGLMPEGAIRRWSGSQRRFNVFPGTLKRIGVDAAGLPYGIGSNNAFVRHDGSAWRLMRLSAGVSDVSIPGAGDALAVQTDAQLYRVALNGEQAAATERLAGNVERVLASPDGSYWYRNTAALLFRCDRAGTCLRFPARAADFAVGPGGTAFIVDDFGNLLRVTPGASLPEIVRRGSTQRVAVGPNDRPWIIERNGDVLASRLFDRDEAVDPLLARATEPTASVTAADPVGTGTTSPTASGVTFNQYSFFMVEVPVSAPGFPNLGRGLLDVTVGLDDQIIVTGFDGPANANPCNTQSNGWQGRNWIYSPQQRRFVHLDFLKRVQYQLAFAGRELTRGTAPPQVAGAPAIPAFHGFLRGCENYHHVEYDAATYAGNAEFFSAGGFSIGRSILGTNVLTANTRNITLVLDADITLDSHVLAIFPERKINVVPLGANYGLADFQRYDQEKFARIGVGATRFDIWATNFDGDVFQYVRATNRFDKRNLFSNDRAQDIGVGKDGSVFIVDMGGNLKKWNPGLNSWIATGRGGVTRVAVTSKGKPVVANFPASQRVFIAQ
jgi:hypothetical protein